MAKVGEEKGGDGSVCLQLPEQVTLLQRSSAGPFGRCIIKAEPATVPLINVTATPVKVARVYLSPLAESRSGLVPQTASGALSAAVAKTTLQPGEATVIRIAGSVPARPGTYVSQLQIITEAGQTVLTPVSIAVAASPGWGIACMGFGLLLLGVLKLLTGEGDVQDKLRDVARTRGEIHAWLQRDPPPQRQTDAVAEIDRDLDDAQDALARPHLFSVVDRRIPDADAALSAARAAAAKLREAQSKVPPGSVEVADLGDEWRGLHERMKSLAMVDIGAGSLKEGLAGPTAIMLRRAWDRLVGLPLQWISVDLESQLERVHLVQDAGETERARAMALATRGWLRRSAADLDRRLTLMMGLNLSAAAMLVSDANVRRVATTMELPPDQRASLLKRLDDADARLAAGSTLEDLAAAIHSVAETETEAIRDQSEALQTRVRIAADAAGEEMSSAPMGAVMDELGAIPHPNVQQKAAIVIRMLEVWRGRLGVVRDDPARASMSAAIDTTEAAARKPDLEAVRRGLAILERDWQAYLPRHIAGAGAAAVVPVCREWRDRDLQQLIETSNLVKLQSGRPEVADWERRLDRARRGLLSVLPEEAKTTDACLGPVVENGREVIAVSQEVFTAVLADVPIPPQARLDAAQTSGVADAIVLAQRLMAEPRDLKLKATTPEADRVAGQPILFTLGGLDPDWGSSVSVRVNWDDGSAPLVSDAEKLRQGERLEHTYAAARTVRPVAVASDRPSPGTSLVVAPPKEAEMGRSEAELFVRPSPATRAERLADMFLTAQFGLALMIAAVVYFWRYHAGSKVFGTRGFDYVEAFALGFAAYYAVADLPKTLAELLVK
jgi:hypothetical protein